MVRIGVTASILLGLWLVNLSLAPALTADDGFVFLQYARNWVDHGFLSWYSDAVTADGYTSFLHQLLVSAAYLLHGSDVASAAWYLNITTGTFTVLLTFAAPLLAARLASLRVGYGLLAASFAAAAISCALSPPYAYWAHSLMDVPTNSLFVLLAAAAAGYLFAASSPTLPVGTMASLALICLGLTRPEGTLVLIVLLPLLAMRCRQRAGGAWARIFPFRPAGNLKALLLPIGLCGVLLGGYHLWHLSRHGHLLPNPVYLKTEKISQDALERGLHYVRTGPGNGFLPMGFERDRGADAPALTVSTDAIHAAIMPAPAAWPYHLQLGLLPLLFLLTFFSAPWSHSYLRHAVRGAALVPLGLLGITLLAGGDKMYLGWRMILPLLPTTLSLAALSLAAMGKGWVRSPAAILFFIAAMGLPLATTVDAAFGRPETCRKVSGACLQDAPRLWPTTLKNYVCDLSNARQDRAFAAAVNATFGTAVSVGQTDYLRAALHMDGKVLDYSGLINADIAHQPGLASANGSSFQSILAGAPDIFLPCCRLISDKRFSSAPRLTRDTWLEHFPGSNHVFPQGTAREQRRFMALYTGASVDLGNGQFFNFLLHRRARVQASAGGRISVIP